MGGSENRVRYAGLTLGWALCLLLSSAVDDESNLMRTIVPLTFSGLAIAGTVGMSGTRRRLWLCGGLAVAWLIAIWVGYTLQRPVTTALSALVGVAFIGVVAQFILGDFLRAKRVTADILWGTVGVYLLIGTGYGLLFFALGALDPDALTGTQQSRSHVYFAFTTMTTLGYGDIVPVSGLARMLAAFTAISGVMFTAVIVARLVAIEIGNALRRRD